MANHSQGMRKFCRVHKNQAVNLLQIPIHGQDDILFLLGVGVKFNKSRVATQFEATNGHRREKNFMAAIAAKFLQ
jgi:hypothetical protein